MTQWETFAMEQKIKAILAAERPPGEWEPHIGYRFMTPYQIAIELKRRFPAEELPDLPIGGEGTGGKFSLTQYVARELSGRIREGHMRGVQMAYLSGAHADRMTFRAPGGQHVEASINHVTLFRLI